MPLLEPEPHFSPKNLILLGVPSLFVAVLCSMLLHHYAHDVVKRHACPGEEIPQVTSISQKYPGEDLPECPVASLAGVCVTLALGVVSFGFLMRFPRNILFAALAFVNASRRLPEALTLFLQMAMGRPSTILVDEGSAIHLLHFKDPTAYLVIVCFYIICLFFFTIIIIHDTKVVPWKWPVAVILFVSLPPLEQYLWKIVAPLVG